MSKDPTRRRRERIKELAAWTRRIGLDPDAVGAFDKIEKQARLSYLVTSLTAQDYAKTVMQLLRSDSKLPVRLEGARL